MRIDHQDETFTLRLRLRLLHPLCRARRAFAISLVPISLSAGLALGCVPGHGVLTDTLPTTSEGMSSTGESTISGGTGDSASSMTSTSAGESTVTSGDVSSTSTGPITSGSTGGTTGGTSDGTTEGMTTEGTTTDDPSTGSSSSSGTDSGTTSGGLGEGECRLDADCDEQLEESCFAPGEVNCGVCQDAEVLCSDEQPCEQGTFCDAVVLDCPCDEPLSYECRANCANDDECGPDRICADEQCVFLSCNDGFVCPETHDCLEGGGDGNDCNRRPCVVDSDCSADDQVCVKGRCFLDFGVCELPAP